MKTIKNMGPKIAAQQRKRIIAIDFDGTITYWQPYPAQGKLNPEAEEFIWKLHSKGYKVVLWTGRVGESYRLAKKQCREWGLPIEFDSRKLLHGATGKLLANFYIDDKSFLGDIDWQKLYEYIVNNVQ